MPGMKPRCLINYASDRGDDQGAMIFARNWMSEGVQGAVESLICVASSSPASSAPALLRSVFSLRRVFWEGEVAGSGLERLALELRAAPATHLLVRRPAVGMVGLFELSPPLADTGMSADTGIARQTYRSSTARSNESARLRHWTTRSSAPTAPECLASAQREMSFRVPMAC
jgi:hypothetical protein